MKIEFDEAEDLLEYAKNAGVPHVGVQLVVKNENAGPLMLQTGVVGQAVRVSAALLLTSVVKPKMGPEDGLLYQRQVLSELILSEEGATMINERITKEKEAAFKLVQEKCPKAAIILGRILP